MADMKIEIDRDAILGESGNYFVYRGTFDRCPVAVKRVFLKYVNDNEEWSWRQLNHRNVVKLLHCERDKDFICYAFELYDASLNQLFLDPNDPKKYKGPMPQPVDAMLQLALGLEHIHSKNFIHGDIKPENVLISGGPTSQGEITLLKWANFGLTKHVSKGARVTSQTRPSGTWLAPELQLTRKRKRGEEENRYEETVKSDVFAQGLVFGTLFLNGQHLYGSLANENEIPGNIIEGYPVNMQKIDGKLRDCYENDLFKKMLAYDPDKRMTSTHVVHQLKAIKNKFAGKELLQLCGPDLRPDITGKIQTLIQLGIDTNAKDDYGRNVLHLLCQHFSNSKLAEAIKLVFDNGIDVNAKDNDGQNAIHYLCRYHSSQNLIEAIQILIQFGIDAKATTNDGSNALHYLRRYNSSPNLNDAIQIFTDLGMDVTTEDNNGWSALHYLRNEDKKEMKIKVNYDSPHTDYFVVVFKGKFGDRDVAVKRVELHCCNMMKEEDARLKLDHPNIVKLLHYEKDNHFMYYALEWCVASLDKLFLDPKDPEKYDGPMPRPIEVLLQLASGLEHIHSKKFIHRDIRPTNVLIMQSPGKYQEMIIKLAHFGLAKSLHHEGSQRWWSAPEVLANRETAAGQEFECFVKSDVFVLGLVFGYLFLKGEHLYGSSEKEIHENIIGMNPVNMRNIDDKLLELYKDNLLSKMLEHDPRKRISSEVVVKQLKVINEMFAEKEKELLKLCGARSISPSHLIQRINDLIRLGINVNAKNDAGRNALHHLCWNNSGPNFINAIRVVIEHKIDVNAKDENDECALHHLCRYISGRNLTEAIQVLVDHRINVNAKNNYKQNALYHLCRHNSGPHLIDAIQLLIQGGIDVNANDKNGQNALHHLCRHNSGPHLVEAIQLLIRSGMDVTAKDRHGQNALHLLCQHNSSTHLTEALRVLIRKGIDVNAKDRLKRNALYYLNENPSSQSLRNAFQLLIQHGISTRTEGYDAEPMLNRLNII